MHVAGRIRSALVTLVLSLATLPFLLGVAQAQTLYAGAFVDGATVADLAAFEELSGRHQDYFMYYVNWEYGPDTELLSALSARGTTPIVTWEPYGRPLDAIGDGSYDGYIREYARGLKAVGRTVLLRPMHEMNGNWYPWGAGVDGNTPEKYVVAFRHIVELFRAEGAVNVRFVFSPNAEGVPDWSADSIPEYFPGDEYVDFNAIDAYNFGTSLPGLTWRSFDSLYGEAYQVLSGISSRPMLIGETASSESGGDKAAWIHQMFYLLKTAFPRIQTVIWFQHSKEMDWPIDSSTASLQAYRKEMGRLNGPPPPPMMPAPPLPGTDTEELGTPPSSPAVPAQSTPPLHAQHPLEHPAEPRSNAGSSAASSEGRDRAAKAGAGGDFGHQSGDLGAEAPPSIQSPQWVDASRTQSLSGQSVVMAARLRSMASMTSGAARSAAAYDAAMRAGLADLVGHVLPQTSR